MATPIAWVMNLDADSELAEPEGYRPSARRQAHIHTWSRRMVQLVSPADRIAWPAREVGRDLPDLAQCFCPTPWALAQATRLGLSVPPAPPLGVLRHVSSRAFNAVLGQTLPAARYAHSLAEVERALGDSPPAQRWVIKRDHSYAGQARVWADAPTLSVAARGFVLRAVGAGQGIQLEPWLARTGDFAQHGYLRPDGSLLVGPVMQQWTSARGAWQRSTPAAAEALSTHEAGALRCEVTKAGQALAHAGYFGPFGVDAFRYRTASGDEAFAQRIEVNARFSMGYPRSLLERALIPQ